MSNSSELDQVAAIAQGAGARIMPIYASDFEIEFKDDRSPLTNADKASHEFIVKRLEKDFPGVPILSEESATVPWQTRRQWSEYWLIDPLDGTKEFIKKNGEFTVNIALIREGVPVIGAVYAPELGVSWFAAEGGGAFKSKGTDKVHISASNLQNNTATRIVGSRSHQSEAIQDFLCNFNMPELVPMGSSIKICSVADGSADLYPRLGPTSEWDTAAAHCVVLEAGGEVVDSSGAPLGYNNKDSLLNPFFLVLGRGELMRPDVIEWFRLAGASN